MKKIFINGKYVDSNSKIIDISNRGLKFGDGLFETILVQNYIPYLWYEHMNRLRNGLRTTRINCDIENLYQQSMRLLRLNNHQNAILRIMIIRGGESKGFLPAYDSEAAIIIIETLDLPRENSMSANWKNKKLWLSKYKKIPSECFPQYIKSNQGLHSIMGKIEANENDCFESVFLNIDKSISETCSGNIFWVKDNKLYTPSLDCNILPGTMREAILRVSHIAVREGRYFLEDLKNADELFITNSVWKTQSIYCIEPLGYNYKNNSNTIEILRNIEEDIKNYEVV